MVHGGSGGNGMRLGGGGRITRGCGDVEAARVGRELRKGREGIRLGHFVPT